MCAYNIDAFAVARTTKQSAVQKGTTVRTKTAATGLYDQECYDLYYGCMDQFCITENANGGSCGCSDTSIDLDKRYAEIKDILVEADRIKTVEVEKVKAGANADIIFGGERKYDKDGNVIKVDQNTEGKDKAQKRQDLMALFDSNVYEEDDEGEVLDIADMVGDMLHSAAQEVCLEQIPEKCDKDLTLLKQMYSRQIVSDCKAYENLIETKSGEAEIVYCTECDYAANVEKAEMHVIEAADEAALERAEVETPNCKSIADVCAYLNMPVEKSVKAVAYKSEKGLILCFVRGDHEVNEVKVINTCNVLEVEMADENMLVEAGTCGGYMGPVGIDPEKVMVVVDHSVMKMHNFCCGANKEGYHMVNVNPGRDFTPTFVADIRLIQEGDPCPHCGGKVAKARGIEVGQVFKLFTKYSAAMNCTFLDENGKENPMVMGCYGIGVSRTMAACIEQNNDKDGMIWPVAIAPYEVLVVPVNTKDEASTAKAEEIYEVLKKAGVEAVIDDRNERPGVKFKDADLIGYPLRVVVGPKTLAEGNIEVKARRTGEVAMLPVDGDYVAAIKEMLAKL
jgi:prolyl-tRNA editing enzyme YbaK/EbsC (Cys-tRNA(Pro) deacylase)